MNGSIGNGHPADDAHDDDPLFHSSSGSGTTAVLRIAVGSTNPSKLRAVEQALRRASYRDRGLEAMPTRKNGDATADSAHFAVPPDCWKLNIQGFDVDSTVAAQPIGNAETLTGAKARAVAAYRAYRHAHHVAPHLAVGMEGGLEWVLPTTNGTCSNKSSSSSCNESNSSGTPAKDSAQPPHPLYCMAWMALYGKRCAATVQAWASADLESYAGDKKPVWGLAKTAAFPIPDAMARLLTPTTTSTTASSGTPTDNDTTTTMPMELGEADEIVFAQQPGMHSGSNNIKNSPDSGTVGKLTDDLIDRSAYYEHAILLALMPWIRPNLYPHGN